MIAFANGGKLVTDVSQLNNINFQNAENVYLDFETTSFDPKLDSLNPWHNCYILGAAITVDDCKDAYYLPVHHHRNKVLVNGNLPLQEVSDWLFRILSTCTRWVNHNVKYDAQVARNCCGISYSGELVDTVTIAKLINSDRMSFGLDNLSKDWLDEDISEYENVFKPYLFKGNNRYNKDYGTIPIDLMAEYACQDALTERKLWHYIEKELDPEFEGVYKTEVALTSELLRMEQIGLKIDPVKLQGFEVLGRNAILQMLEQMKDIVGFHFNPASSDQLYDVLVNTYGLPVMGYTEITEKGGGGNPSFGKEEMAKYLVHPDSPVALIELISKYKGLNQLLNLFIGPYQTLHTNNILHPTFNQCVRTGRMSCKEPNMTQLNKAAKTFIECEEGYSFLSCDYAQIEFRTIVHYTKAEDCIEDYRRDPDTDFHQWVADQCGIDRRPAKTVNFMLGFGGGKKKTVQTLTQDRTIIGELKEQANGDMELFTRLCNIRAEEVYNGYHERLPTIKPTSKRAESVCKQRGYIRNMYGRRRHLPYDHAYKAFNALNQSTAADLLKNRAVALARYFREFEPDCSIICLVHDEFLMKVPTKRLLNQPEQIIDRQGLGWKTMKDDINNEFVGKIVKILETDPTGKFSVPIRTSTEVSHTNWAACKPIERSW